MSKISKAIADAIFNAKSGKGYDEVLKGLQYDIDHCVVKVWPEHPDVKLPTYAKEGDACMDVYIDSVEKKDDGRIVYHTGLHFRIPEDYEMEIRPRSSMTKSTAIMQNAPGTLDSGYTGELMIVHRTISRPYDGVAEFSVGDRVAQILVRRRENILLKLVEYEDELGNTERGAGGFGSSGR